MQRPVKGTHSVRAVSPGAGAPEDSLPPVWPSVTEESHGGAGHRPRHRRGAGELLVAAAASVIGTLIAPRPAGSWLTRWVDRIVSGVFRLATRNIPGLQAPRPGARRAGRRHPDRAAGRLGGPL